MTSTMNLEAIASKLLEDQHLSLQSCKVIQTLWAGYGHIARITVTSQSEQSMNTSNSTHTYILKHVSPPSSTSVRRSGRKSKPANQTPESVDEGHIRKLLSYQIEQSFYVHLAPSMPEDIAVAACLGYSSSPGQQDRNDNLSTAMLLTDLRKNFPIAGEDSAELSTARVHATLSWLANFHGFWWKQLQDGPKSLAWENCVLPPLEHVSKYQTLSIEFYNVSSVRGLVWLRGGYSHLTTRLKEYEFLKANKHSEWSRKLCQPVPGYSGKTIAELVDMVLHPTPQEDYRSYPYLTLIHGDVKSENLFTTLDGKQVAFYDFQYVGLGLGVSDLAKLFTVSIPLTMLVDDEDDIYDANEKGLKMGNGEEGLLRRYCKDLEARAGRSYAWPLFVRHWETALVDWLRFQASWGFWGNTEWLEGRVRNILQDEVWLTWLKNAVEFTGR